MSTTYDSSRICLPDYLRQRPIADKWRSHDPIFLTGGLFDGINILAQDQGVENIAATPTKTLIGPAGRYLYTGNTSNRCGLKWNYSTYAVGSTYTLFMVMSYPSTTIETARQLIANGSNSGGSRFNYQIRNRNTTTELVHTHQSSSGADTFNTGLFCNAKEVSTFSVSIAGTKAEACLNGEVATKTNTYTPEDPGKGDTTLMHITGGAATSTEASIYLIVLFRSFISNETIQGLHMDPASLFKPYKHSIGYVAPTGGVNTNRNLLLMGVG